MRKQQAASLFLDEFNLNSVFRIYRVYHRARSNVCHTRCYWYIYESLLYFSSNHQSRCTIPEPCFKKILEIFIATYRISNEIDNFYYRSMCFTVQISLWCLLLLNPLLWLHLMLLLLLDYGLPCVYKAVCKLCHFS